MRKPNATQMALSMSYRLVVKQQLQGMLLVQT